MHDDLRARDLQIRGRDEGKDLQFGDVVRISDATSRNSVSIASRTRAEPLWYSVTPTTNASEFPRANE